MAAGPSEYPVQFTVDYPAEVRNRVTVFSRWNLNLLRFENRVVAYLLVLRDDYPSTDAYPPFRLEP
ncbi:hypothetical protein [Frankia sp. Cppng1_Ct_nod]|uniref:hypothetical protein n=1 Tax=Frankia sp. Cppng1_Ct_nod TaxID=2897162 RepID=UPI0010418977|nr:hypothetical protein [Frankia sp. Cppng1_Ct_nod]